jgi:hypothetical protein
VRGTWRAGDLRRRPIQELIFTGALSSCVSGDV